MMRSSAGVGRHFCLRWLARRHGFCGAPWSRSSNPSYPCGWSTFLCRRWWTSCRKSPNSSSHCLLLPSRLSKCPRSLFRTPSRSECRSGLRSWRNSWWKCRCLPSATASSSRRCRRLCCHGTWMQVASDGATARDQGSSTGGCLAHSMPSGPSRRDSPPAQGGIEVLGRAEAHLAPVVDVPATKQLKNLQSFEFLDEPQIQFIDRLLLLPVSPQRQVRTVQTVQKTGVSQCSSWVVVDMPGVCNDRCLDLDSAENCGGSAVAVGAVPGAVVDAPVVCRRQVPFGSDSTENCLEVPQV